VSAHSDDTAVTTLTLCRYRGAERIWAFNRMGSARRDLARADGLRFWKLLGTGHGNGYSLKPDLSRYGLLAVWESVEASAAFLADAPLMRSYREHAAEAWSVTMLTLQTHGGWSGRNPFGGAVVPLATESPVAVLTRASIRPSRLRAFWRAVPATSERLAAAPGLLASVGTGEVPFVRPATFSVWRSERAMLTFAYGSSEHRDVIRRRRDEGWYSEELFARFLPVASEGTWNGHDPLAGLLASTQRAGEGARPWA
jgi:hypothetical protein